MNTDMTYETTSTDSAATELLGQKLGASLRGGEIIELTSDLGGGKTTFTRGLARGAGSKDTVASPTFTISKIYKAERFEIHHFDFYRLHEPGVMAAELAEVTGDPQTVVVIEWADIVQDVLPPGRMTVALRQTPAGDRSITFRCPETLGYLIDAVKA